MPVIDRIDLEAKRIYLAAGVRQYHPVADIYRELRALRRTDHTLRGFDVPVVASGNVPKGGGKYTPRYATFRQGWRVVPEDVSHTLYVSGEQITDDGQAGPAVIDTALLSPGVNVMVHYEPPAAEIIRVETGSGVTAQDKTDIIQGVWEYKPSLRGQPLSNFAVVMVDATDHITPKPGLQVAGEMSLDGAPFVPLTNTVCEVGAGVYIVDLTGPERDGYVVTYRFSASGADVRYLTMLLEG